MALVRRLILAVALVFFTTTACAHPTPLAANELREVELEVSAQLKAMGFEHAGAVAGVMEDLPANVLGVAYCLRETNTPTRVAYDVSLDMSNPIDRGTIAHEQVHVDQCASGRTAMWYRQGLEYALRRGYRGDDAINAAITYMRGEAEHEAYAAEDRWLHTYGYE